MTRLSEYPDGVTRVDALRRLLERHEMQTPRSWLRGYLTALVARLWAWWR